MSQTASSLIAVVARKEFRAYFQSSVALIFLGPLLMLFLVVFMEHPCLIPWPLGSWPFGC